MNSNHIKSSLISILEKQGYRYSDNHFSLPDNDRETKRRVQLLSKAERISEHYAFLNNNMSSIRECLLDGRELDVSKISPKLILVESESKWETLFKWWNLIWWSLPYERPYGRQMRYIVWDSYHKAPIGLIGLQSPILSWAVRDSFLNINKEERDYWINQSLSAQRLGALPPYNQVLGGKLVALVLSSQEVVENYRNKYIGTQTLIRNRTIPPRLLFVTTSGAYGKSSIYNRLKIENDWIAHFIGYSKGKGSFHIPNAFFDVLIEYLNSEGINTQRGYGSGPSRKMRLIRQALEYLGINNGIDHGIKRAVYLFPYANNLHDVIEFNAEPLWCQRNLPELVGYWKERWGLARAKKDNSYTLFRPTNFIKQEFAHISTMIEDYNQWIKLL